MNKKLKLDNDVEIKESGDNTIYNHSTRRKYGNDYMRSQKVTTVDHLNKQHTTNELKKLKRKERGNHKLWMERVSRSQEYGKKIHSINREGVYQDMIKDTEERDAKWMQNLSELYGEDEAKKIHDKHWSVRDEQEKIKYGV